MAQNRHFGTISEHLLGHVKRHSQIPNRVQTHYFSPSDRPCIRLKTPITKRLVCEIGKGPAPRVYVHQLLDLIADGALVTEAVFLKYFESILVVVWVFDKKSEGVEYLTFDAGCDVHVVLLVAEVKRGDEAV